MKEANRHPLEFSHRLTSIVRPVKVKLLKDTIRVTCASEKQKTTLLSVTNWFGKPVSVTEPWGKAPVADRRPASLRGNFFVVSVALTEAEIVAETTADSARRVVKWVDEQQTATTSVILTFQAPLPDFVCIGFERYRLKPYIPQPMRCIK